jgi:hypothetical protein
LRIDGRAARRGLAAMAATARLSGIMLGPPSEALENLRNRLLARLKDE